MAERILITGGSGNVATLLRPRMVRPDRTLRLLDLRDPRPGAGEEGIVASITDLDAMTEASAGIDAIVHLGGQSRESDLDDVVQRNVLGTFRVLEAARRNGIGRVILASSNHAAGFHRRTGDLPSGGLPADVPGRPDTLYGWSKVAIESAGQLYADRFGMDIICLRIGSWLPAPLDLRGLALWLSPDDGARLIEACLSTEASGFRVVWGISRNTRRWCSLAAGEEIGYYPKDDAEAFATELIARHGEPDFATDPILTRIGGEWCDIRLGEAF